LFHKSHQKLRPFLLYRPQGKKKRESFSAAWLQRKEKIEEERGRVSGDFKWNKETLPLSNNPISDFPPDTSSHPLKSWPRSEESQLPEETPR
jgi:hypothetical protein